jgi:hypothetical protein
VCFLANNVAVERIFAAATALEVCGSCFAMDTSGLRHSDRINSGLLECGKSMMNFIYAVCYAMFTIAQRRRGGYSCA